MMEIANQVKGKCFLLIRSPSDVNTDVYIPLCYSRTPGAGGPPKVISHLECGLEEGDQEKTLQQIVLLFLAKRCTCFDQGP